MDFNVEARKLQLENLEQFISSYKSKIQSVLNNLDWNVKEIMRDNQLITCSLDTGHKVPQRSVDSHISKCILRKEGYDLNEQFLSEAQQGPFSIHIDDHEKIEILSAAHKSVKNFKSGWNGQDPDPKTSDRFISTFSTDERLALYNYAVTNTITPFTLPEFDIVNPKRNDEKLLTYKEKLALERDSKRRKIKYKSIHTSHKNYMEILREVIEGQMELYKDWLNTKNNGTNATYEQNSDTAKLELECIRSRAVSRSSNNSNSSNSIRKKHDEKYSEAGGDNKSTSRKTSVDKELQKFTNDPTNYQKRRSRSYDNRRRYEDDCRSKHREHRHQRDCSPLDNRYKHDKHRRRYSREKKSRSERLNGYKNYKN